MKATVGERGQVTIPKTLRSRLGIKPGMKLDFREEAGKLIVIKRTETDPVEKVFGCLGHGIDTDAVLASLRGKKA